MCFPCGLSDNLKPRSHRSKSLAGISRSTEAQSCCKSTLVALRWKRTDFAEGTLPAWDRMQACAGFQTADKRARYATFKKSELEMRGCKSFMTCGFCLLQLCFTSHRSLLSFIFDALKAMFVLFLELQMKHFFFLMHLDSCHTAIFIVQHRKASSFMSLKLVSIKLILASLIVNISQFAQPLFLQSARPYILDIFILCQVCNLTNEHF